MRATRYFYGWAVVAALSVVGGLSMGMGVGNFGFFIAPMSEELGMGLTPFGLAATARLIGFAVSAPLIGRVLDHRGTRGPMAIAVALMGGSVASMALVDAGWQMIGLLFFMGLLGFWGSSTLYITVPVAKWFIRKRGKAMSLVFLGVPMGIALSGPITQAMLETLGWRATWVTLGLTGSMSILLLTWLVLRNAPEDMGLEPDGDPAPDQVGQSATTPPAGSEYSWSVRDAFRSSTFWRLSLAFGTVMLAMGSIGLYWVPYYAALGFGTQAVAWAFGAQAFSQVIVGAGLATVIDRFQPRFLAAAGFAAVIGALVITMNATSEWQMLVAGAMSGSGVGAAMLLHAHIWPHYFGRNHIGAIRGLALPLTLSFSAAGSAAPGLIFDTFGSYSPAWLLAIGSLAAGIVLLAITPRPLHGTTVRADRPA